MKLFSYIRIHYTIIMDNSKEQISLVVLPTTVTSRTLAHLRGKYIKRQLTQLENSGILTGAVRKVILDAMNDFTRELEKELGIV